VCGRKSHYALREGEAPAEPSALEGCLTIDHRPVRPRWGRLREACVHYRGNRCARPPAMRCDPDWGRSDRTTL